MSEEWNAKLVKALHEHYSVHKLLDRQRNLKSIWCRVSFEASFDSKQLKLVTALSETKRLFRLFQFYTKNESFGVRLIQNKQKSNRNSLIESIFWYFWENLGLLRFVLVCFETIYFGCFASLLKQRVSMFDWTQKTNETVDREHILVFLKKI